MVHDILVIVQALLILAALFMTGYFVGMARATDHNIKHYRQIKEEAERETKKYANR